MTDFYNKLDSQSNVHNVTIHEQHMNNDVHGHTIIKTHGNKNINLKNSQIVEMDIHRNYNLWRYNSKSDLSTLLSNAGQGHIQIDRSSGSGHIKNVWLRLVVQNNTGSDCLLNSIPLCIREIEITSPNGTSIQIIRGDELWKNICRMYSEDEFRRVSQMINTNKIFGKGRIIADGEQKTYFLPLLGCFLECCEIYPAFIDGDLNCYIRFANTNVSVLSGSSPTIQELSLDIQMEQISSKKRAMMLQKHKSVPHHYFLPYSRNQRVTQTLNASTTYSINLSSLKGDVVWIDFIIREDITGNSSRNYAPITNFRLLNNEGDEISGQNLIYSNFNKLIQQPNYFPSYFSEYKNIYSFVFSIEDSAPVHLLMSGQKLGSYPFTTYERLEFTCPSAGVNEILNLTVTALSVSGAYRFKWQTPNSVEYSDSLAFDATPAIMASTVENMSSFDGDIAFSTSHDAGLTVQATFSGNYGYKPLYNEGYYLTIEPDTLLDTNGHNLNVRTIVATAGVEGINSGASHTLDIYAYTTSLLTILPNGSIDVKHS